MHGYWEKKPADALRPYVAAFWIWEAVGPPASFRVLPDGCIDILFTSPRGRSTDTYSLAVVGTMTRHIEVSRNDVPLLLGIRFRPGGAVPFLGCEASELTDMCLPLEDLWDHEAVRLLERLEEEVSIEGRLRLLEETLRERLPVALCGDTRILRALGSNLGEHFRRSPWELAAEMGLSPRQLRRRFEAEVGIGPKLFSRVNRFQRLLEKVLEQGGNWADLALDFGYYDQPHLVRDFKEFTGLSPTQYLATR